MNTHQTIFVSLCIQVINDLSNGFRHGTHGNYNILCIFGSIIGKGVIFPSGDFCNLLHISLNNIRNGIVERITGLFGLEEDVWVLGGSSGDRVLRIQCTCAKFSQRILINQSSNLFLIHCLNFLNFV